MPLITFIVVLFSAIISAGLGVVRGHLAIAHSGLLMGRPSARLQEVGASDVSLSSIF